MTYRLQKAIEESDIVTVTDLVGVQNKYNPNAKLPNGATILNYACFIYVIGRAERVTIVRQLLGSGSLTTTQDNDGRTPLHAVVSAVKAKPHYTPQTADDERNAIFLAQILVEDGAADLFQGDNEGVTAYGYALGKNLGELCQVIATKQDDGKAKGKEIISR